jgi:hypothetical protein
LACAFSGGIPLGVGSLTRQLFEGGYRSNRRRCQRKIPRVLDWYRVTGRDSFGTLAASLKSLTLYADRQCSRALAALHGGRSRQPRCTSRIVRARSSCTPPGIASTLANYKTFPPMLALAHLQQQIRKGLKRLRSKP